MGVNYGKAHHYLLQLEKQYANGTTPKDSEIAASLGWARRALSKDVADAPKLVFADNGMLMAVCPECEQEIHEEEHNYCPHCGQAIEWSEN